MKAEIWFDLVEEQCERWTDFQRIFMDYYWGDQAQSKVRERLYTARFDENYGSTREEYAMRQINMARYLDPPMNDKDIIQYVARHFKEDIRDVIAIQGIEKVENLLRYLKGIDGIKPIRRRRTDRFRGDYENRREGGNSSNNNNTNGYERRQFTSNFRPRYENRWENRRPPEANNNNERTNQQRRENNNQEFRRTGQENNRSNRNDNFPRRETRSVGRDFTGHKQKERRQ